MAQRTDSSTRVITFVLMVVFAILSGVVIYAAWKGGSNDIRSRAASEEIILKQWTFDAGSEGWSAKDEGSSYVKGGNFSIVIGPKGEIRKQEYQCTGTKKNGNYRCKNKVTNTVLDPRMENDSVGVALQYPVNRFRIRFLATKPAAPSPTCTLPPPCAYLKSPCRYMKANVSYCPIGREYEARPLTDKNVDSQFSKQVPGTVSKMPVTVSYRYDGRNAFEDPVQLVAVADGSFQEYSFDFPSTAKLKKVAALEISFGSMRFQPNMRIDVDTISLVGVKETKPTDHTQTVTGIVEQGESFAGGKAGTYYLYGRANTFETTDALAKEAYLVKGMRYLLVNGSASQCPAGAFCKMIARPSIDFSQFVGKQVVATGFVSDPVKITQTKDAPMPDQARIMSVPTLAVTSMRLLDTAKPCQPLPTECTSSGGLKLCKVALSDGSRWCAPTPTPGPTAPAGCSYQQVECFKAPCNPVLVCATPKPVQFTCPATQWVDCMPGPDRESRTQCSSAYLEWAKGNCPNFQGAAY